MQPSIQLMSQLPQSQPSAPAKQVNLYPSGAGGWGGVCAPPSPVRALIVSDSFGCLLSADRIHALFGSLPEMMSVEHNWNLVTILNTTLFNIIAFCFCADTCLAQKLGKKGSLGEHNNATEDTCLSNIHPFFLHSPDPCYLSSVLSLSPRLSLLHSVVAVSAPATTSLNLAAGSHANRRSCRAGRSLGQTDLNTGEWVRK